MKKFVIVKPGCKEIGNELINHMSIYAYAVEIGAEVINRSPYTYPRVLRMLHALYARYVGWRHGACSLNAWRAPVFLPPTKALAQEAACDVLYFFGWVFRNTVGIAKYRKEVLTAFTPSDRVQEKVAHILTLFPVGRTRIGVHVRQKPFPNFPGGDFLVSAERVRQMVDEYVRRNNISVENLSLLIVSDTSLPERFFAEYTHHVLYGNTEVNLFALAQSSVVIGTNTTFSNLAAWFSDVPHIVTTEESVDWVYYQGQKTYFENKYATFAY